MASAVLVYDDSLPRWQRADCECWRLGLGAVAPRLPADHSALSGLHQNEQCSSTERTGFTRYTCIVRADSDSARGSRRNRHGALSGGSRVAVGRLSARTCIVCLCSTTPMTLGKGRGNLRVRSYLRLIRNWHDTGIGHCAGLSRLSESRRELRSRTHARCLRPSAQGRHRWRGR